MNFYKCIKEQEKDINTPNAFISYAFANSHVFNNFRSYYAQYKPSLTFNRIYCDNGKNIIIDDYGSAFEVNKITEYLEPYELVIDELSKKLIEKKKNDKIEIVPLYVNGDEVKYLITISVANKQGKNICIQCFNTCIYDGLFSLYKNLRHWSGYYRMFYDLIFNKAYPRPCIKYF